MLMKLNVHNVVPLGFSTQNQQTFSMELGGWGQVNMIEHLMGLRDRTIDFGAVVGVQVNLDAWQTLLDQCINVQNSQPAGMCLGRTKPAYQQDAGGGGGRIGAGWHGACATKR